MFTRPFVLLALGLATAIPTAQTRVSPSASVPLDMEVAGGRPVVTLNLNGHESVFILDTGAGHSVIESAHSATVGASFLEDTTIGSPLGKERIPSQLVEVAQVQLGDLSFGPHAFSTFDAAAFPMPGGATGVLSVRELAVHHAVMIDFHGARLHLFDESPSGIPWSPLQPDTEQLNASLQLGEHSVSVHLDTGSPGTVLLPIRYAEELGLDDQLRVVGSMRTVDAVREIQAAPFDGRATLGGMDIPITSLSFADIPVANVGMGLFGDNQIIVDRGAARFALIPNRGPARSAAATPAAAPNAGSTAGRTAGGAMVRQETLPVPLGLQGRPTGDALIVAGVGPESRAARAGLVAGDRIKAINGVALADIPAAELRDHMIAVPLVFTVEREGSTIEVAVPDR